MVVVDQAEYSNSANTKEALGRFTTGIFEANAGANATSNFDPTQASPGVLEPLLTQDPGQLSSREEHFCTNLRKKVEFARDVFGTLNLRSK